MLIERADAERLPLGLPLVIRRGEGRRHVEGLSLFNQDDDPHGAAESIHALHLGCTHWSFETLMVSSSVQFVERQRWPRNTTKLGLSESM